MDAREEILYYGRKMIEEGLVASTWGNISLRTEKNQVYITPSGMEYQELTIEDLVLLNLDGEVLKGKRKPSSELLMHLEIYKQRSDVLAVIHTHSLYASAYAVSRIPVPPLIEDMAQVVGGTVEVAEYALPGTLELAKNVATVLSDKGAALLANHGVVGVGYNLGEAYKACLLVEKTAHIGIAARNLGEVHSLSEEEVKWMRKAYLNSYGQPNDETV